MNYLPKIALSLGIITTLSACMSTQAPVASTSEASPPPTPAYSRSTENQQLGTQWGEGISSGVTTVNLYRASSRPVDTIQIQYAAINYSGRNIQEAMLANGRIGMSILDNYGRKWPITENPQGLYLKGQDGERYQIFFQNYSQNTYEIVTTVDGLDVLNGSPGSLNNRGYVLYPNSTLTIQGFRKNTNEVAAFRFSAPADAYAANTAAGSPRNIGVIGTAVFELNNPRPNRQPNSRPGQTTPQAFPGDNHGGNYAAPPNYRH